MFQELNQINSKPKPFQYYTAQELWTDEYTSNQMLKYHLDGSVDISSRKFSFIEKSVNWIVSYFKLSEKSKVADFGCGPGLYTSRFAEKRIQVTGIDFSKNSIKYAKHQAEKEKLKIEYINENYLEYQMQDKYDLIIMIMCDFCALSLAQRSLLLDTFFSSLNPDGSLLLDVYSLHAFNKKEETSLYSKNQLNGFWSDKDYYGFVNTFKYEQEKVSLDKYTIIEETRMFTIYNWLQYFNQDFIKIEFMNAGFEIAEYFSNVAGEKISQESDEFAVVARKQ